MEYHNDYDDNDTTNTTTTTTTTNFRNLRKKKLLNNSPISDMLYCPPMTCGPERFQKSTKEHRLLSLLSHPPELENNILLL